MSELELYTSAEVAELLRMNPQVVQRKLQAGEIPGYRIGREWRVERSQLMTWLERHSNQHRSAVDRWFLADGRLSRLPKKRAERLQVLERFATSFMPGRTYEESEVNTILRAFHDDVASLRREMVEEGIFVRSQRGVYRLTSARGEPALRRG